MFELFDIVQAKVSFNDSPVMQSEKGTIVEVLDNGKSIAYEVEFCDEYGKTIEILTLTGDNLIKVSS